MKKIRVFESKSMTNRALILNSFTSNQIEIKNKAKDIIELEKALDLFSRDKTDFFISEGGTTLRFLLSRISRKPGVYEIHCSKRLLDRPQEDLFNSLSLLGVKIERVQNTLIVETQGWTEPLKEIEVNCLQSTQFLSSICLSAANLSFDLYIKPVNLNKSLPYWEMTKSLMEDAGILITEKNQILKIKKKQLVVEELEAEIDISSAFSLVGSFLFNEDIELMGFPKESLQADFYFLEILKKMGVSYHFTKEGLIIHSVDILKPVDVDLSQSPDLLPVLSSLCGLTKGTSIIRNLSHARGKESDRVEKSFELLKKMNIECSIKDSDLVITGKDFLKVDTFEFDPDQDHRMAMAAAVFMSRGQKINLKDKSVVDKSFPEFWNLIGINHE